MTIPPIGQIPRRALISGVSLASKCQVTTIDPYPFVTGNFVRITDLDSCMPSLRGMDQINDNLYLIESIDSLNFYIKDTITFKYIDSTGFTPYISGGRCNLDNHTFIFNPPPP